MNIVVCVKHTPVTTAEKRLDSDYILDRESTDNAINTYDEPAIEEALRLQEAHGGTVTFLCMGPDEAVESLRKALAMAGDREAKAMLVSDEDLRGSDILATALVLATAAKRAAPDLVIVGLRSDDAATGVLAGALAEYLAMPLLSQANHVEINGTVIRTQRRLADGHTVQESTLPVVLGVTDAINTPRYPSLKGIMGAKKKPLEELSLADLGLEPDQVGLTGARTKVVATSAPPPRAKGEVVEDTGDAADRILQFLAARKAL